MIRLTRLGALLLALALFLTACGAPGALSMSTIWILWRIRAL